MSLNIDLNGIKQGICEAYQKISFQANEWMGRAIVLIKSGTQQALPYLQDKKIAAISLIAVNLILYECADLSSHILNNYVPNRLFLGSESAKEVVDIIIGFGLIIAGVNAFAKHAHLPLTSLAIVSISVATFVLRTAFVKLEVEDSGSVDVKLV